MAITDSYATVEEYRAGVEKPDAGDDTEIERDLATISRHIEHITGRFFQSDTSVVNRIYTTPYRGFLNAEAENPWRGLGRFSSMDVDDIATTTGLVIVIDEDRDGSFADETPLAASDYRLLPLNAPLGPEPKPYNRIEIPSWSSRMGAWPPATQVQITARWGWPAVPEPVRAACIHLTGILRLESPRATSRISEAIGETIGISREGQSIIKDLTRWYRRITV